MTRNSYLSDVSDDEWVFVAPYLTLMREDAPQREHPLREVFNGLRYVVHTGMQWRMMPQDLPPWHAVYQQTQRWLESGAFEDMAHDLRMLMREIDDRMQQPRAAILDSRTLQSTPESGGHASWDGHKRRMRSKVHMAIDTLGQLLAIVVTRANEQYRAQVDEPAKQIQEVIGDSVEVAFVDQGYIGDKTAPAAPTPTSARPASRWRRANDLVPKSGLVLRSLAHLATTQRLDR